ncbi:hypothetical protein [Robertkochia solimangrovi]|uniref:hypothetical protein n=1 Tax=Robertkochia solimangrovi TaxID=2213046 RepID=UPI0011802003|nr:hypothetical protein [Robertkochia solimangrovi]TRZ46211.1 hypothetical protein DMZ48_02850 [Robertkochia solimangrovi]
MSNLYLLLGFVFVMSALLFAWRSSLACTGKQVTFLYSGFTNLERSVFLQILQNVSERSRELIAGQLSYFEERKKWREYYEDHMILELFGDHESPLPDDFRYENKGDVKLCVAQFRVEEEIYEMTIRSYNGRIWGWKIYPNPSSIQSEKVEILGSLTFLESPERVHVPLKSATRVKV